MTTAVAAPTTGTALLPTAPVDLSGHIDRYGGIPRTDPDGLLAAVAAAGLGGRGGAGFPAARKLQAVRNARGRAVVVANASEGEPASAKDVTLLRVNPHLVLDGIQIAADLTGADEAHLYLRDAPGLVAALLAAAAQRRAAGRDRVPVIVTAAVAGFVAGQETAVLRRLAGGPGLPGYHPERVSVRGLHGRPTLVNNVETLARLALIARDRPATAAMLLTVRRADGTAEVVDVDLGTPFASILGPVAGAGVLIGGYHGTWLPSPVARRLPLDPAAVAAYGASLGAGVVAELPADRCGLRETARVLHYLALESAGQCGPCRNGLPRIAGAFVALADATAGAAVVSELHRWAGLVVGRGACAHPDGSVRLMASALRTFDAEVAVHLAGRCGAQSYDPFLPTGARP